MFPNMINANSWFFYAVLSAVFAALTAIFAKVGIRGVDSDLATLVRTVIIVFVLTAFVWLTSKWSNPFALSSRTWLFLTLSGLATGASWVCKSETRLGLRRWTSSVSFWSPCLPLFSWASGPPGENGSALPWSLPV